VVSPFPIASVATTKNLFVDCLARAEKEVDAVMVAGDSRQHQHRV
jgi:hypothetical protein